MFYLQKLWYKNVGCLLCGLYMKHATLLSIIYTKRSNADVYIHTGDDPFIHAGLCLYVDRNRLLSIEVANKHIYLPIDWPIFTVEMYRKLLRCLQNSKPSCV